MNEDDATVGTDEETQEVDAEKPMRKPAKKKGREGAAKKGGKPGRFAEPRPRNR